MAPTETSAQAKQGVIRSAEPVPAPSLQPRVDMTPRELQAPLQPRAIDNRSDQAGDDAAAPLAPFAVEGPGDARQNATASTRVNPSIGRESTSTVEYSYWPLYAGAGAAALSLLALALLRRRDRRTAQQRDAEHSRAQDSERSSRIVDEEIARERAESEERLRAAETAAAEAAQAAMAAAAAAAAAVTAAQRSERNVDADLSTIQEPEQKRLDPRIEAAHRLFDLLHHAERDVEPFLRLLDEAVPNDASSSEARNVVASWHESMLGTRNRLAEALARYNAPVDLQPVDPAPDLQNAMARLIDHAARMNALMVAQQQQNSAILHWSRLLPGALVQLFWRAQTAKYSSTMPQLPKVPDAPAPGATFAPAAMAAPAPARAPVPVPPPAPRQVRTSDKAIQQALRGVNSHAART